MPTDDRRDPAIERLFGEQAADPATEPHRYRLQQRVLEGRPELERLQLRGVVPSTGAHARIRNQQYVDCREDAQTTLRQLGPALDALEQQSKAARALPPGTEREDALLVSLNETQDTLTEVALLALTLAIDPEGD